ncbi:MAG: hypothetical protein ACYC6C_05515 [Coriobacteriia bacterium]
MKGSWLEAYWRGFLLMQVGFVILLGSYVPGLVLGALYPALGGATGGGILPPLFASAAAAVAGWLLGGTRESAKSVLVAGSIPIGLGLLVNFWPMVSVFAAALAAFAVKRASGRRSVEQAHQADAQKVEST